MAHYIVTFDLQEAGSEQAPVRRELETYRVHRQRQDYVWILVSDKPASQIRNELAEVCEPGDMLYLECLYGDAAWGGQPMDTHVVLH